MECVALLCYVFARSSCGKRFGVNSTLANILCTLHFIHVSVRPLQQEINLTLTNVSCC